MNYTRFLQPALFCAMLLFSIGAASGQTQKKTNRIKEAHHQHSLPTTLEPKLDSLFLSYNQNTPGVAITVLQNGKVIAKKAYGMASLEHNAPFTHNTILRLPYSEGREFIAIAAAIMEAEGILSLKDKVRKYFPDLPAWSEPVTIRDLLNHRSGFADEWATLLLTQASMTNRFDKSQFLNFLYLQPKPEVAPGKGYMYSNSDYGLLRLILEKASGQNLRLWMQKNLFAPLAMHNTRLHDDKDEVITGFAPQYYQYGKGYKTWTSDKTSPGGNYYIATSVNDLEKWAAAHSDASSFISKAVARLFVDSQLMPGKDKNWVFGYKEKGLGRFQILAHQGVSERTYISRIKEKGLTMVLLSNNMGSSYPYHEQILSHVLGITKQPFVNKSFKKEKVYYTTKELEQFTGMYIEEDTVTYESFSKKRREFVELIVLDDSLKMKFGRDIAPLDYIAWGVFKDRDYAAYLEFPKEDADRNTLLAHIHQNNKVVRVVKDTAQAWQPLLKDMQGFTGTYYSPHLDFYWTIFLDKDHQLIVKRATIADTPLVPDIDKAFRLRIEKFPEDGYNSRVTFHQDSKGNTTHFTVWDTRLMHHRFDKVENTNPK